MHEEDINNINSNNNIIPNNDTNEFSIIFLPDTQKYSEKYPEIFYSQTEWIKNNLSKMNIKFVIHAGDIVENAKKEALHQVVLEQKNKLKAKKVEKKSSNIMQSLFDEATE